MQIEGRVLRCTSGVSADRPFPYIHTGHLHGHPVGHPGHHRAQLAHDHLRRVAAALPQTPASPSRLVSSCCADCTAPLCTCQAAWRAYCGLSRGSRRWGPSTLSPTCAAGARRSVPACRAAPQAGYARFLYHPPPLCHTPASSCIIDRLLSHPPPLCRTPTGSSSSP